MQNWIPIGLLQAAHYMQQAQWQRNGALYIRCGYGAL